MIPIAKRSAFPRTRFYRARVHSDSRFSIPFSPAQFDSPLSFPKFRICRNRGSLIRSEVGRGHGLKICVLVRVLRTWEARNFKCNKDLMSVDFLLLDEKDCLIQGSIHHQLLYKFRDNLREEEIFLIRDFEVFRSGIHYKITDHDYMIRFTDATTLEETVEVNFLIPSEKFHLHGHSDLLSLMDKIDVLPVDTHAPSGANQSKRVILHICMEEGINLRLTIWDALADSFATKFGEIDERNIVIIATSILPKSFGGKLCLSASSSTKIYLNGDFEVVKDFRTRHNVHPEIEDGESKNNDPNE
ncbi:hypothetical protein ACS0TY_009855 [Phlomoides rotata]